MLLDLGIVVLVAAAVSAIVCRAIIAAGPLDQPDNHRKLHPSPTPTSGGLGVGAGFGAAMLALSLFSSVWRYEVHPRGVALLWVSALFAYPLLLIGFVDDTRHLSARFKFVVYSVLAIAAASLMGVVQHLYVGGFVLHLSYAVGLVGTALWVFTLVNIVNFMDGANGLAMGSVAIGLLVLALIALDRDVYSAAALSFCAVGALAGFLVWNIGGRLFAGDSGALFAGALAAFACLIPIARADVSAFVAPLLFFPVLADGLLTLLFRVRRGRSLLVAHTEHIYQIARAAGWRDQRISAAYWAATAFCAVVAGIAARDETRWAPFVALAIFSAAALVVDNLIRRWAIKNGLLA